jgi:hypothetical protein
MEIVDFIIIGSGCTGAMVAETLCQTNKDVLMIDTGLKPEKQIENNQSFIEKRRYDVEQRNYFLGKNLEALKQSTHPNIPQQTAQRIFMTEQTDHLLPLSTDSFFPVESLAFGGLGNGWGLGCYAFSENELKRVGLPIKEMQAAYKFVAKKIGISGEGHDDASIYCHNGQIDLQNPIQLNAPAESLLKKYSKLSTKLNKSNMYVGRPSLALLTAPLDDRRPYAYKDLDFYENEGNSAYRPTLTIDKNIKEGKLKYINRLLAVRYKEEANCVHVECIDIDTKEAKCFYAKKIIFACGTLSTARIVLRSTAKDHKLPVLCNAYTYMPMFYLPFLGKAYGGSMSGLAQLAMFYDEKQNHESVAMASIYNYRSLLNFRILKQLPINYSDGIKLLKDLMPALFVAGIFHPADYQNQNYIQLRNSDSITGDCLYTHYTYEKEEAEMIKKTEKAFSKAFFDLHCIITKRMRTATGGSIHYAGTLPFTPVEKPFHLLENGRLSGSKSVFVADGSGLKFLPGKGLTLTLMANAHRVAKLLIENE